MDSCLKYWGTDSERNELEMYIGQSLTRGEDRKFLTGGGSYVDDIVLPEIAFAAFVRSPHAHAKIRRIDDKVARGRPGVLAVLTDREWQADGLGRLAMLHPMPFSDGRPANEALRRVLSDGRVRHVGECVAMVVAETRNLRWMPPS